jgi:hypothetical protein
MAKKSPTTKKMAPKAVKSKITTKTAKKRVAKKTAPPVPVEFLEGSFQEIPGEIEFPPVAEPAPVVDEGADYTTPVLLPPTIVVQQVEVNWFSRIIGWFKGLFS